MICTQRINLIEKSEFLKKLLIYSCYTALCVAGSAQIYQNRQSLPPVIQGLKNIMQPPEQTLQAAAHMPVPRTEIQPETPVKTAAPKPVIHAETKIAPSLPIQRVYEDLRAALRTRKGIEVRLDSNAVAVTLPSDHFFQIGTATLKPEKMLAAIGLIEAIRERAPEASIAIEGYTDDLQVIRRRQQFPSNWELSAARAVNLLHLFENSGFSKDQLQARAFGESRPRMANRDAQGERIPRNLFLNRRLVIRIEGRNGAT
jgi:flagellar motor protein MotB